MQLHILLYSFLIDSLGNNLIVDKLRHIGFSASKLIFFFIIYLESVNRFFSEHARIIKSNL
jgi:hypothetical protein